MTLLQQSFQRTYKRQVLSTSWDNWVWNHQAYSSADRWRKWIHSALLDRHFGKGA